MKTLSRMVRYKYHNAHQSCILRDKFQIIVHVYIYIRLDSLIDKALDLRIMGREFESRYG